MKKKYRKLKLTPFERDQAINIPPIVRTKSSKLLQEETEKGQNPVVVRAFQRIITAIVHDVPDLETEVRLVR